MIGQVHSNPAVLLKVLVGTLALMIAGAFAPSPMHASLTARQAAVFTAEAEPATTIFDAALDNGDVDFDDTITAARKCGFCMG